MYTLITIIILIISYCTYKYLRAAIKHNDFNLMNLDVAGHISLFVSMTCTFVFASTMVISLVIIVILIRVYLP
jgi:hypothetical protein